MKYHKKTYKIHFLIRFLLFTVKILNLRLSVTCLPFTCNYMNMCYNIIRNGPVYFILRSITMEIKIGTNIKRLRLAKGMTQEQLAELLCVSTAAVSKWESQNTYPDITLLFPLASIFGISTDELLGYDEAKVEAEIDKILEECRRLYIEGRFEEKAKLIESARQKYPHDYRIMCKYMWDLAGGTAGNNAEAILANQDELSQICNCILDGCTKDDIRAEAVNMKAKLFHAQGDTEAALEILSTLPQVGSALLKEQLFYKNTPEFMYWNKKNCYGMLDSMSIKLARIIRFDPKLSVKEKIARLSKMAEALSEISKKDDCAFFCIAEQAVYTLLAGMLTQENADIEDIIEARECQFRAMAKTMACAENDYVLKELIADTYKTNDLISWQLNRLISSPHKQFASLREIPEYMEMLNKWAR